MQVHYSLDHLPSIAFPVVTVGSFDGVHVGHRVIIERLKVLAKEVAGSSVLITFHPHPRKVLYPDTAGKDLRLINSQAEKVRLLEGTGLDHLVIIEFTRNFAQTSSEDFVKHHLVGKLHAHTIVVGFNHYFGHKREGNYDSLYRLREIYGFEVEEIPVQEIQHETVSSTKIRKALTEGNIQRANAHLEHHYLMLTESVLNTDYTEKNGHPSYLIAEQDSTKLIPPIGGYAVSVSDMDSSSKGLVLIGTHALLFLPLEATSCPEESIQGEIRFHKRISEEEAIESRLLLDVIRELIY